MTEKQARVLYILGDFLFSAIAWICFTYFRFETLGAVITHRSFEAYFFSHDVLLGQILVPIIWLILFYYSGFYNEPFKKSLISVFLLSTSAVFIGTLLIFFLLILNDQPEFSRIYYEHIIVLFILEFFAIYIFRMIFANYLQSQIHKGKIKFNTLIIGTGTQAQKIRRHIEKYKQKTGYHFLGFISTNENIQSKLTSSGTEPVFHENHLAEIIRKNDIKVLIIGFEESDIKGTLHQMYTYYKYGLPVKIPTKIYYNLFGHLTLQKIEEGFLTDIFVNNFPEWQKNIKLTADKIMAILSLLIFSPLMLYFALRIKSDSKGNIIYSQERIGYKGKPFRIYKFRTMYEDAEKDGPALSRPNDSRVTPLGVFLRKYRLDELPQLWNVLRGDMSVVGPRPERAYFIHKIEKEFPYFHLILNTRPGITSYSVVTFGYAKNIDEMLLRTKYDLIYYRNMSLYLDFRIIILTFRTVFLGLGM